MLPWWFWVLLWTVLVLAMLLFLVLAGIKLFRGFMALAGDVGDAMDAMDATGAALGADADPRDYPEISDRTPSGVAALFQDPDEARRAHDHGKLSRSTARRNSRVQRKSRRGQPQRVADLELF